VVRVEEDVVDAQSTRRPVRGKRSVRVNIQLQPSLLLLQENWSLSETSNLPVVKIVRTEEGEVVLHVQLSVHSHVVAEQVVVNIASRNAVKVSCNVSSTSRHYRDLKKSKTNFWLAG
jgi:hypothetical protein